MPKYEHIFYLTCILECMCLFLQVKFPIIDKQSQFYIFGNLGVKAFGPDYFPGFQQIDKQTQLSISLASF